MFHSEHRSSDYLELFYVGPPLSSSQASAGRGSRSKETGVGSWISSGRPIPAVRGREWPLETPKLCPDFLWRGIL